MRNLSSGDTTSTGTAWNNEVCTNVVNGTVECVHMHTVNQLNIGLQIIILPNNKGYTTIVHDRTMEFP